MKVKEDKGLTFDIENEGVSTIKEDSFEYYTDTFEPGQTKQRLKVGREVEGSADWNGNATSNLDMNNFEIENSGNIILPTGKYFAVQDGSGLVLDGTFDKIYYSGGEWKATDSNGTYSLYSSGGGGGSWVGLATSDLNMDGYEIGNIGKLKIPVGTNLY